MTENNQFLDPPIAPQYRSDEPEQWEEVSSEMSDDGEMHDEELQQNDGYRSICRE